MKKLLKLLVSVVILFSISTNTAKAYDFSAVNSDGDTIYYDITSSTNPYTVAVARGNYSGSINIPSTVSYNCNIYSVTSIGDSAFYSCSSLTSITIPNSVTSIGKRAVSDCTGLTSITIPNSVTIIGNTAFCGCRNLTSVTIGNSVTSIGNFAFGWCNLTSVTIPNSVASISDSVFYACIYLTSITIGNSVTSIGSNAFVSCSFPSITIPNNVTSIGSNCFMWCTHFTSMIDMSPTPQTIYGSTFSWISSTIPVYVPCSSVPTYQSSNWGTHFSNIRGYTADTINDTIHLGQIYNQNGFSASQAGIYIKIHTPLTMTGGCYNATILNLVNPRYDTTIQVSIYQGESYNFNNRVLSIAGTYYDTLQTINGCDSILILNLHVIPVNDSCSISIIPNDTNLHSNTSTQLQLTTNQEATFYHWSPSIGLSDTTIRNPIATIPFNTSRQYILKAMYEDSVNFVYNGDFELGDTGFTTEYNYFNPNLGGGLVDGSCVVYDSANGPTLSGYFINCTNVNSNYLYIDGSTSSTHLAFYQTIANVEPNSDYVLSADFINVYAGIHSAMIQFYINDTILNNTPDIVSGPNCTSISHFHYIINSGNNNQLNIKIKDLCTEGIGNDFSMDNVSLRKLCVAYDTINISNYHNIYDTIEISICEGENYTFGGVALTVSGTYIDTLQTSNGYDSIVTLNLNVNPIVNIDITQSICGGETYSLNGQTFSTSGIYYDTLQTINGCDSIIRLNLYVNPIATTNLTASICQGEHYTQNGFNVNQAGIYRDTLQTTNGCDSIITLNLSVYQPTTNNITASICEGEVYTQNGFNANITGTYVRNLQTIHGCDSTVILHLTVYPASHTNLTAHICTGEIYTDNGFYVSQAGTYTHNLQTINGCDSIVTLNLSVYQPASTYLSEEICQGETYTQNGFNVSQAGIYRDTLQTTNGCDSIIALNLIVNPRYDTTIQASICQGENYTENGFNQNATGLYINSLQTINGCDSIVRLNLIVNPRYDTTIQASICQGENYTENGFNQNATGLYINSLQTINGCDSITRLNLIVNPIYNDTKNVYIDQGQSYLFNGLRINQTGIYYDSLQTVNGCDSIITINLTINTPINIYVPNAFEPMNNTNNKFYIYTDDEDVMIKEFKIYNRWGGLVYESNDIKEGWDGKYKGKLCPEGTYVYRLLYYEKGTPDLVFDKTGSLIIIY
jgi:gliding motility-associated-like protein